MILTDQPNHGRVTPARTVLISGASIAGPTLAYWLNRYGYEVTVVERAPAPRSGGYPIDIRGTALGVVERMGLMPRLREAHIEMERMTFYEGEGDVVATLRPQSVTGGVAGRDLEVRRGDLTDALYASVRDDVEFRFNDSIVSLDQSGHGVDVTFQGGGSRTFDLVIAADGMHSHTRELVFGPEEPFHRYLGYSFGILSMPNLLGLKNEVAMWNDPGRAAAFYATGDEVNALLTFAQPETPFHAFGDLQTQRDLIGEVFAGVGWVVPDMLAALRDTDDLFFDAVAQIRMPRWSSGRVALVGDSAFAPSFLTGQGTSLALVGAYMLAASLAHGDHVEGFAAYERDTRGFVTANQDLVGAGRVTLMPTTAEDLRRRDERLRNLSAMPPAEGNPVHSALVLPEPPVVERPSR
ncbi:FAD-dependent monooxygenase [Microbispora hainanensis]|uniref:FAD-dependent oxidoreductase n=1 Tax=Microbispora hainanensis TaxID=568844 RepID=A0A544YUK1_9ACTN|nr:FAD-dependent monooxygenase [Microbispora hainanensis]TQS20444.1 FAD-dependent oxidoreductase [Microbispora hainanensis]